RARPVRRGSRDALPSELLPLHRAERRARHQLRGVRRERVRDVQGHRLDRGARQRDGAPGGVRSGRLRSRALHRVRVRRRHRTARAAQVGRRGHPPVLRERPALPGAVPAVRLPYHWLCALARVPGDPESVASGLAARGFEVASIHHGRQPVIDFEITANRPDCLSVLGLAREASAAFGLPLLAPDRPMPPAAQPSPDRRGTAPSAVERPQPFDVVIEDAELCPRYCAQVFEVRATGHTPDWMRDRLEACGVRTISPVVDVTNYVMLEMGQPTHAFDYTTLAGHRLRIRRAAPGEKVTTLDGVERPLDPDMLVIADAERPQAVAGVMGGAHSEIGAARTLMVLESACFKPGSVRRTSKKLGLKTEASTRFERGADIDAAPAAIARIAALLQQIGAAQPLGPTIDRYPSPRPP